MKATRLLYTTVWLLLAAKFGKCVFYEAIFTQIKKTIPYVTRSGVYNDEFSEMCVPFRSPLSCILVAKENVLFSR